MAKKKNPEHDLAKVLLKELKPFLKKGVRKIREKFSDNSSYFVSLQNRKGRIIDITFDLDGTKITEIDVFQEDNPLDLAKKLSHYQFSQNNSKTKTK